MSEAFSPTARVAAPLGTGTLADATTKPSPVLFSGEVGRVIACPADGTVRVAVGDVEWPAQRALSCLVEPMVGDRVLVASAGEEAFVLAVLDRLLPGEAALSVAGASRVALTAPQLAVEAREGLALKAGAALEIEAPRLRIGADTLALVGRLVTFIADQLRATARLSETVAEQIAVQAGERTTLVRGTDVSEAGMLVQTIDTIASTTATTAVLVAKEDVRFDGKRVTVG